MVDSLTTKTFRGLNWSYLSTIVNAVLQIGFTAIMARLLEPAAFGLVAMAAIILRFGEYFAQMGVGSCILGYADDDVNSEVIEAIRKGSMCSLNCYEEVALAEKLLALHPWAEMVRFARTGGEACAIAIRIARAATGKSKVAFCGYHGWHDWYLAANIGESALGKASDILRVQVPSS